MNVETLKKQIINTNGRTFSVKFTKKDGTIRDMVCRLGVTKHLKGGEKTNTNPNHVIVFDMKKEGYKTVDLEKVIQAKIDGTNYTLKH